MAGLPVCNARVKVGPPLSCNVPSMGSVLARSLAVVRLHVLALSRLCPCEMMKPSLLKQFPSASEPETIEFLIVREAVSLKISPPVPTGPLEQEGVEVLVVAIVRLTSSNLSNPSSGIDVH